MLQHVMTEELGGPEGALAAMAYLQGMVESSEVHPPKTRKTVEALDEALGIYGDRLNSVKKQCKTILTSARSVSPDPETKDSTQMIKVSIEYPENYL